MKGYVLATSRRKNVEGSARELLKIEGVQGVHAVTGQYDFLIEVEGEDLDSVFDVVGKQMLSIDGIGETETLMSLKTFG